MTARRHVSGAGRGAWAIACPLHGHPERKGGDKAVAVPIFVRASAVAVRDSSAKRPPNRLAAGLVARLGLEMTMQRASVRTSGAWGAMRRAG
jgi:hypothetical protein